MYLHRLFIVLLAALFLLANSGRLYAQEILKPQSGQEGKDVVWVPTPQALVDKMLDIAKLTPADYVMDLGSGDGRLVISAAKRGATALGIEYNPDLVELSIYKAAMAGISNRANFKQADLFEIDFSKATVITLFLLPELNLRLRPRLLELKPGTRIVSNSFNMGDWEADEIASVQEDCYSYCEALLWIVPAKVGGKWKLDQGELILDQEFQMISGTLSTGNSSVIISEGRMRGNEITFKANGATYSGTISGKSIQGTFVVKGETKKWSASR
jgi:SAM-dependent methyltransferase